MANRMAQWERNFYGAMADREEKRRQLVAQEQAANRAANEKKAAEVGMDYDSYTRAMSTKEGAEQIRKMRTQGRQAINQAAQNKVETKLAILRGKTEQKQTKKTGTAVGGTSMSGGQLAKSGAVPMVGREQLAENYAEYQRKKAAENMAAFSPLTKEQQNAADSYAKWTKWYSQDAMDEATAASTQQDILRQMGREAAPTAEELQAAAQAGNAASKGEAKKEYSDTQAMAKRYEEFMSLAKERAERNGMTVEEFLGEGGPGYGAFGTEEELQAAREAYEKQQQGESLSPAMEEIQQRQIRKNQGYTGVMEGADDLLSQGKTGEWMAQWNREYQQAAADYMAQAEQLQLMRASGSATKDAIQTAQDALDEKARQLDELKAMSVLGMEDYGEKSQANAEAMEKNDSYRLVNDPEEARERAYDNEYNGLQPSLFNKSYLLTDSERGIFNYLYASEGRDAAIAYMKSLENRLDYRYAQEKEQANTALAQEHPVLASLGAVAARGGPYSIGQNLVKLGTIATGGELNPYGGEFLGVRTSNTLQGTVSEGIENPALNLVYNAGMSMADNLMAMASSAGNAGLASLQMSASAFGATAYDNLIRGGSTKEAALAGGASALTEYLTEHMGFDRITKSWTVGKNAMGYKGALLQFVKGFIPEGLEEVPGNFVDAAVDDWLMGGKSKRNLRIQELMQDEDMTLDQAISQADAEFVGDTVMSFLAGGLAGGTMEAGSYVGGVHQGRSAAKADARTLSQELGVDRKTQQRALEMEYGVRAPDEKVLEAAREQIETEAEKADHASFKAKAETEGQAVTVTGMAKSGEGAQVTVKGEDGTEKTVDLSKVTFASDDLRKAYAYASSYGETDTARQFLAGYEMSRDTVENYRRGFEAAYSEGYTGRKATGGAATWAGGLNPTIRTLAQQAGRAAQNRQTGRLLFSEEVDTAVRRAVEAMPREYTEGYTGVVNRVEGPLTAYESVQMAVADQLGKKFGMVYTFVDSGTDIAAQEGVQGAYRAGTNHAVIALDAQEGMLLSVAGHETLHYVKEWTGKHEAARAQYEAFQDYVLEKLQAAEGYDLEARIAQKQEQYRQAGQELDRAGAIEEIVADGMATVFAREENVRDFLESQDVSLVERVVSTVKRLVKEIRAAIQRLAKRNPEAAAMLKQDADTLQEIADRFDRLGAMATAVRENMETARKRIETERRTETRPQAEPANQADTRPQAEPANWAETRMQEETANRAETRAQAETANRSETMPQAETVNRTETRTQAETVNRAETRTQAEPMNRSETSMARKRLPKNLSQKMHQLVEALPTRYTEGYTGVVNLTNRKLSDFHAVQMAVLDRIAKGLGMVYIVQDNYIIGSVTQDMHGYRAQGTNVVKSGLYDQTGGLLGIAGHEALHYVKEWTGKNEAARGQYEAFQDFMLEKLQATEGYDLEERIKQKQEVYREAGIRLDREGAVEEIVADSVAAVFSREENVQDFLRGQNMSLVDRVMDAVKRMVKKTKNAIRSIAQNNPEIEAMLKQDADTLQEIADRFDRLGAMARAVRESEAGGAETKFSLKDAEPDYANLPDSAFYEDGRIYDYDFLTAQKDAKVVTVPSLDELMQNGRINRADVVEAGKRNAGGAKTARGYAQVTNTYTGRTLNVSNESIKHGMHGQKKRILTNAQLGAVVGDIVKEGIPINGLKTEDRNALGTYAMVTMCETSDGKPIMAVTHVDMQRGEVQDISFVDMVHSVNGRLYKKSEPGSSPIDASAGKPSHPSRFTISISDLLLEVNSSFQSILSEDVLNRLNETRSPEGAYTDKVKFSLKDVDTQNDEMTRLMQENGELRETVRMLSERLRGSENRVSPEEVRKLARRFKEDTGTRVPLKTITENMQTAFDAMANARGSGDSQAAMEMMGSIAQDMLEKSTQANREMYDQYEEMRGYFHGGIGLSETQWQEVKKLYGGNAAFRRAIAGLGLKVLPEGSRANLDQNWAELCEQWPEFFKPDTNEGDQVEAVVAAMSAVQVRYENPYGSSLPQYASDMAMLMYEEYLGMPEIKSGQARQVEKLTRQLSDARAKIREQAAKARKVGRLEARIQEYREAAQGRYRRQAQRRKDNQDYAKMRGQVIRQRDQLLRKLREPRLGAFIPQSMNDAVTELMRAIDFEGRLEGYQDKKQRNTLTADALKRAKDAYLALGMPDADGAQGPFTAYVNGDLASDFDLLAETADGKAARDLTMREMEALRNIVAGYTAAVLNEDRLFMQERADSLSQTGEAMASGMLTRREKMKQGGFAKWGADAARKGLLKPVTVFGQFRGTPMETAWKALRNAENVHIRNVSQAQEYLEEALKQYGQQESIRTEGSQAKRSRAKTYTTADGRKLQLTDQELMTLYATWKREQLVGTNHLLGGGFTLANAPKGTSTAPIRLAGPDLQEMIDRGLTRQQKDYVDHMVEYLSGQCADWGNEVTMQLYGVEKFHEDYYIPFSVNKNYVAQEPATEQDSRLKTGSFTKALTDKASSPLEIRPFTEIWCQHVEKMSDYNAFVLPIEDMTRLMNYKTEGGERIRALVKRYYSTQTAEYIMNFLSRLNGNSATEAGGSWLNAFMSKAKGAAVTFNLSVAIQQAGSAARAMAEIDPKYFYGGTALAAANLGRRAAGKLTGKGSISSSYAELEKYAPIAILKGWGYFDTNMSRGMYQRARNTRMDKLNEWGGKLAELGDRATWARIWEAVKLEVADTHPDLTKGSEAYFEACAERFTEVIDRTQVVDSVFQRAEWATEKGMMKQQMAFMSEPLTMYNMVYRAVEDLSGANGKAAKAKAGKQLARTLGSITVSSAVTAALKSIVTALRDRDNEKKDEEGNIIGVRTGADKWLDAMGGNFAENMLGIGSIFTNAVQGAFSFTGSGDLTTQWMSDLAGAMKEMQKGAEGDWWKAAYKMTRGSSSLLGIGFGNLWRDVESIYRSADEYFARDSLAGAAWDRSLPFETRVAAAEKNYVMKKQGDGRKVNSGIYYDLMLTAYFDSGFGEKFSLAADAAIRTGGGESMISTFKTRMRAVEDRIPQAAQALMDGNLDEYSRLYREMADGDIGERAVASMICSELNKYFPEDDSIVTEGLIIELERDDVATDPIKQAQKKAYNAAVESGDPEKLKNAVKLLRQLGESDADLRTRVKDSYQTEYCWAVWTGDTKKQLELSSMMKGAGVGIDNADLRAWTSDLSDSKINDQLYGLMKQSDGKQAHIIHKYLVEANGSEAVDKKLKNWCRRSIKGTEHESSVRAALRQMGYSQATIDGWFQ